MGTVKRFHAVTRSEPARVDISLGRSKQTTDQLVGRDVLGMSRENRQREVHKALWYWRRQGFPYVTLTEDETTCELDRLLRSPITGGDTWSCLGSSTVGLRLANSFHPQMWHARSHRHLLSPFDYFQNNEHLLTMLERAPRFWPDRRCWSAQAVRNLLRIYAGGRVANFRPVVARHVIARLTKVGDTVIDFSSGYGGRLLACVSLERRYVGIDPARRQMEGLRAMCQQLQRRVDVHADLIRGCAEEVLPSLPSASADLVFSSPPFFNLEIYSDESTQSAHRYPTYTRWLERFLHVVIAESYRVLRRSKCFAIHTPPFDSHPMGRHVVEFARRYLRFEGIIHVEMTARPLQRASCGRALRIEPIAIFQKR